MDQDRWSCCVGMISVAQTDVIIGITYRYNVDVQSGLLGPYLIVIGLVPIRPSQSEPASLVASRLKTGLLGLHKVAPQRSREEMAQFSEKFIDSIRFHFLAVPRLGEVVVP